MTIFSLNIKGSAKTATNAAKSWGCHVLRIHHDSKSETKTSAIIADCSPHMIGRWFGGTPPSVPYPPGALLAYRELETAESEVEAAWADERKRGMKLDFDDDDRGSLNGGWETRVFEGTLFACEEDPDFWYESMRDARRDCESEILVESGWWFILSNPEYDSGYNGPFDTKQDAEEALSQHEWVASNLNGLESGAFSVSTLTPGLHGKPSYRYFGELSEALQYARTRALRGPRMRAGGRAYFILDHSGVLYRVFRGMRGQEQRRGAEHPERNREFIVVQKNAGLLSNGKTRWVWDHTQSIEIEDPGVLENRRRTPAQYPYTQARKNLPPRGR